MRREAAQSLSGPATAWRAPVAGIIFLLSISAIVLLSRQANPLILPYVFVLSAGSALVSLLLCRPIGAPLSVNARSVLTVAAIGHAIALFGHTVWEDDFYRFLWDGWRLLESGTPYGIAPDDYWDDPTVPDAMLDVLAWVNYPYLPTIYGPVLQILFALISALFGSDEIGLRLLFAVGSLGLTALLMRRHSPGHAALFAWNPLVVVETTLHLHPDIFLALALFAALLAGKRHPAVVGVFLGIAVGVKVVALALWPTLLRLRPIALATAFATLAVLYGIFAIQGHGVGLDSTETFATQWYFNPLGFELLVHAIGPEWGRLAGLAIAGVLVLWFHASSRDFDTVPIAPIFGAILLFAPAVNAWYLLWLLPFALDRRDIWPYVASTVLPLSYLTGRTLGIAEMDEWQVHPFAQYAQWSALACAIVIDVLRARRAANKATTSPQTPTEPRVSVIIPALNEAGSVGQAVAGIIAAKPQGLIEVIVADNGSTDGTAAEAAEAGAKVTAQPERGYGAACLAALDAVDPDTTIILFMDADLSDIPEEAHSLLAPIIAGEADIVIGSRTLGTVDPGAMSAPQKFGNWLAPFLVRLIWRARYTDLGPFRAIHRNALERLRMADRDFGWTIEMQVRAAKIGLRITEKPVNYRKRLGVSKISGTVKGVVAAGWKILYVIVREAFGDFDRKANEK